MNILIYFSFRLSVTQVTPPILHIGFSCLNRQPINHSRDELISSLFEAHFITTHYNNNNVYIPLSRFL